jgi:hypothetical protein
MIAAIAASFSARDFADETFCVGRKRAAANKAVSPSPAEAQETGNLRQRIETEEGKDN